MLSTNKTQPKFDDTPKKLRVLTTNKVRIKTEAEMAVAAKVQIEALRPLVQVRPTRKYTGSLLTTVNMEGVKANERRKALMAKVKGQERTTAAKARAKKALIVAAQAEPEKKRRTRKKKSE